jgi:hypothetical protein
MTTIRTHAPQYAVQLENKPTFSYGISAFAAVATPTDVVIIQGSAAHRVVIRRIIAIGAATAAGNMPILIVRRSSAGTIGSAVLTAVSAAKHDTNQSAATAVVSTVGTANVTTPGTLAGTFAAGRIQMTALGTGVAVEPFLLDYGGLFDKPIILRGVSDFCCINLAGAAIPSGGVIDFTIELEEDDVS